MEYVFFPIFFKIFVLNSIISVAFAEIRPICGNRQRVASTIGEDPETVFEKIEELRQCVTSLPYLKSRTDDQFLVSFLRNARYNVKKALMKIDAFYAIRNVYPDVYDNRNIFKNRQIRNLLERNTWFLMPQGDEPKTAVFIGRFGAYDPKKYTFDDTCFVGTLAYEILAWENDDAVISGAWVIFDLADITEAHVAQYSYAVFRKYFLINPEMTPIEIKGFHFINTTPFTRILVEIVRHVVEKPLKHKIHVHGSDLTSLYTFVLKDQLPIEYGGSELCFSELADDLTKQLENYANIFTQDEMLGTNESLREGVSPIRKYFKNFKVPRNQS